MFALTYKDELIQTFSDCYKDVHGIRPRWIHWDNYSEGEVQEMLAKLEEDAEQHFAREQEEEKRSIAMFEQRIQDMIDYGAKDRETAIRWLHDTFETNGDSEYLCYHLGLPYGYLKEK